MCYNFSGSYRYRPITAFARPSVPPPRAALLAYCKVDAVARGTGTVPSSVQFRCCSHFPGAKTFSKWGTVHYGRPAPPRPAADNI